MSQAHSANNPSRQSTEPLPQYSALANPGSLLGTLQTRHAQWVNWAIGYGVLAVLCLFAGMFDDRTFQGISTWNKPFKFATSLAVYFLTLAWFANLLEPGYFATQRGKLLSTIPIICALFEMTYILIQGARNEASHYNETSSLYMVMYGLMGVGAVLLVASCAWMGASILRYRGSSDPWVLSVAIGLIATFVLGGGFGVYLGNASAHWVGGVASDAGGLPLVHWSRTGGDLRVAHFFGIHAMQVIPAAGAIVLWLQNNARLGNNAGKVALVSFSIGFAAFTTSTFVQAIRGLPVI